MEFIFYLKQLFDSGFPIDTELLVSHAIATSVFSFLILSVVGESCSSPRMEVRTWISI